MGESAGNVHPSGLSALSRFGYHVFHHAVRRGGPTAYEQAINYFGATNALIAGADQYLMRHRQRRRFRAGEGSGKIGIMLGVQNSEHFRRLKDVEIFFALGQRVSQLTYNSRNMSATARPSGATKGSATPAWRSSAR